MVKVSYQLVPDLESVQAILSKSDSPRESSSHDFCKAALFKISENLL